MDKIALITGITGQDGAYLAEFLLQGYIVHGVKRRSSLFNTDRIDHLYQDPHVKDARFFLHFCDLTDATNLIRIIQQVQPDEIYNLAAMPTNLYGSGDNYDLNNSHVLPALIRKMHEAKVVDAKEVVLWGSGTPKREFLYVDDLLMHWFFSLPWMRNVMMSWLHQLHAR